MDNTLKIAIWNANGLAQHSLEVKQFLSINNIDIMMISESRFTNKTYMKIPKYTIYATNHPDNTAHAGTALIVKDTLKHYELPKYHQEHLQATTIAVQDQSKEIAFSAIYCPPKHKITKQQFTDFFQTLGPCFIAGGDYNGKHQTWGSRVTVTRGRELLKSIQDNNLHYLSTGQPTYWPTDRRKLPDLLDFCVIKGISERYIKAESNLDLSSDHSPVIVTYSSKVLTRSLPPTLHSKRTNWEYFREIIQEKVQLNIPLKTDIDLFNAVEHLNQTLQDAAWEATPDNEEQGTLDRCPLIIRQKIAEKRRLRRIWQNSRSPRDKTNFNNAAQNLKIFLKQHKNQEIQNYLSCLTPYEATDASLWRATKRLKRPTMFIPPIRLPDGSWARSDEEKATAFANHMSTVLQPLPRTCTVEEEQTIYHTLAEPLEAQPSLKPVKVKQVITVVKSLNSHKAPGYDLLTAGLLKQLPEKGFKLITYIFNAVLRLKIFPEQWKVAQILMIPKPGKNPEDITSYRPISLLPVVSKLFEKLLLQKIQTMLAEKNTLPQHQFGFREGHGTIEQVHRIVTKINHDFNLKRYCTAVFLDIRQAFDKVWHTGLLYKIRRDLPQMYEIIKSYLDGRTFQIKLREVLTDLYLISSGVPQGSILGPVLYLIYTADLPTTPQTLSATYADDTAVLASHSDPRVASNYLQNILNKIHTWLQLWRIQVNETKSVQTTFTLRRETCPPVTLNGEPIPQQDNVKYLGIHLDRRLTWKTHIMKKRMQLGLKFRQMYWLIGRTSSLSLENKLLLYKTIIKPIWTYGLQLWGSASNSNLEIIQRFQNKVVRTIANAPRYVPNWVLQQDLPLPTVHEEIRRASATYLTKLSVHPNTLAVNLLERQCAQRLKRHDPLDLETRFQ